MLTSAGVSELEREGEGERPMSQRRSSHNTIDTNPGSVPLAPDCHKSHKASEQDGGRRPNREVREAKTHSTDQTAAQDKWQPLYGGSICNIMRQAPHI